VDAALCRSSSLQQVPDSIDYDMPDLMQEQQQQQQQQQHQHQQNQLQQQQRRQAEQLQRQESDSRQPAHRLKRHSQNQVSARHPLSDASCMCCCSAVVGAVQCGLQLYSANACSASALAMMVLTQHRSLPGAVCFANQRLSWDGSSARSRCAAAGATAAAIGEPGSCCAGCPMCWKQPGWETLQQYLKQHEHSGCCSGCAWAPWHCLAIISHRLRWQALTVAALDNGST